MNKDQWQRIEKIFYSATDLPPDQRDAFVREACAGDEALEREVRSLLDAKPDTESFLGSAPPLPQNVAAPMPTRGKYCPKCSQRYPTSARFCASDHEVLSLKDPYRLVGQTLMDKYKILALIGLGGMGAVYCAHHLGIDRRVAFKILQPNVALGSEYVMELFEREAKLAGRLAHENIVDVKDAGHTPDGISYIVMEWLEGRTLDEELSNQGRFGFKRAIGIIKQITAALSEAHAKRVVHRDLKPGNIMLVDTPDGRDQVKVLDFGIGKIIEETTANSPVSALVGTPQYASPEQLTVGGHVDGRSDLYSLGVIFYRLLGGQLPFNCSSMGELLQMQLTATPPPLGALRPETPAAIQVLINHMLAKDAAQRPQSAGEVLTRLEQILVQLPTEVLDSPAAATKLDGGSSGQELSLRTTEEMSAGSLPTRPHTNVQHQVPAAEPVSEAETLARAAKTGKRTGALLPYGVAALAVVMAGGYGLYRYRLNDGQNLQATSEMRIKPAESPSPAQTASVLQPTPTASAVASPVVPKNQGPPTRPRPSPTPAVDRQAQLNRQKATEHLQRARELYRQLDYQSALRECNAALKLNPQQPGARELQRQLMETIRIKNRR